MAKIEARQINRRYTLQQQLGSGSFGVVHEASDQADPAQPVALKLLAGQKGEAALTLGEEFRALANLWHPNIARVLDFGVDRETGEPFYTMELVRGTDFVSAAQAAGPDELLDLVAQGLRALAYVHARGLVHADLKPANMLVESAERAAHARADRVKLLDFGLARSSADLSRSVGGTAHYLAPELTRGSNPSPASDLYAFGALVYHAATGQPPFTGTVDEVIEAHRTRAPRPPRALKRTLPEALEFVLLRLLAKDPQDRPGSAREVLETLARFSGKDLPLDTPQTRALRLRSGPFVGRVAEMAELRAQVDLLVIGRPHAGLVLVRGESGSGKTRLARELSHQLQIYGVEVHRTACPREGGGAFRALVEPIGRLYRAAPEALRTRFAEDVARLDPALVARPGAAGGAAAGERDADDAGAPDRAVLIAHLAEFLLERATSPLAIVIDDLQHADQATLDLLAHLAPRARSRRLLLLGLEREHAARHLHALPPPSRGRKRGSASASAAELPASPPAPGATAHDRAHDHAHDHAPASSSWLQRANPLILPLAPMPPEEVEALARGLSSSGELSEQVARWLREAAGGNPFLAEEVMRLTEETGEGTDLPSSIAALLAARLARLSTGSRAVAEALAAWGRPAPVVALRAALDQPGRALEDALSDLADRKLARPEEDSPGTWGLVSQAFGDVVLEQLDPRARRKLHARIASYLEVLARGGAEHLTDEVALHHRTAGNQSQALEWTLLAARRNARLCNHEEALREYQAALELSDRSDRKLRLEIEEAAAQIAEAAGQPEQALAHLGNARRLAGEAGDEAAALRSIGATGRIHNVRGEVPRALKVLKEGLTQAEASGASGSPSHPREYASLCRLMAQTLLNAGQPENAESYCAKGLAVLGDEATAGLTWTMGHVLAVKGRRAEALRCWERACEIAERTGKLVELLRALLSRAEEHLLRGEPEQARQLAARALELARARRDVPRQATAMWQLAEIAVHEGDLEAAEALAFESRAVAERVGYLGLLHGSMMVQAAIARARGHHDTALELLWETFRGHHRDGDDYSQAFRERLVGRAYLEVGDLKKAHSFLPRALERARRVAEPTLLADCLLSNGALHLREKRLARAEADLREAFGLLDRLGHRTTFARVVVMLGELSLLRGDVKRATDHASRALALASGAGARALAVRARVLLGRTLAAAGDADHQAREVLEASFAEARALGAPETIVRAGHALGQHLLRTAGAEDAAQRAAAREAYKEAVLALREVTTRLGPEQAAGYTAEDTRSRLLSEWAVVQSEGEAAQTMPDLPRGSELVEAIARLNENLDPEALLGVLVDASLSLTGAERGAILIQDSAGQMSVQVARAAGKTLQRAGFSPSMTAVERALAEGQPVVASDVAAGGPVSASESILALDLKSVVAVPLAHRKQVLGVLYQDSHSVTRTFSALDLQLLALFAQHAAIALSNARAWREIEGLKRRLQSENLYLRQEIEQAVNLPGIVGTSTSLKKALASVERVAPTDSTVLIRGETGTGKEVLARAIHAQSHRAQAALIKVNLAAVPAELIESELFGHEKGSFTGATARRVGRFELADGGTLFLDEIGDLPMPVQVKLLRVLQERELERLGGTQTIKVDVRVIAATNRDLEDLIRNRLFREDLFYRLNVFPVELPPLRERGDDILRIAAHLISRQAKALGRPISAVDENTRRILMGYRWPGNIRELGNVIERACILAKGPVLTADTLPDNLRAPVEEAPASGDSIPLSQAVRDLKARMIRDALARTGGNQAQAAKALGLQRSNLNRMIKELEL